VPTGYRALSTHDKAGTAIVATGSCHFANYLAHDRFQVITEHPTEGFVFDPTYLGIQRSTDCIFIQLVLNEGRAVEQKQRFYKAVADGLHQRLSLRREDVFINLVEVTKENWSFGNGEAQYVTAPK
jgi:phenylpyruvate tautomerase PptA (4-oxalocrotonate tautomerase family)